MTQKYSLAEVVRLGIEIEKNGLAFYSAIARSISSKPVREVCLFVAGEEKKHCATFESIARDISNEAPPELFTDEYIAYINRLAQEYVFTHPDKGADIARTLATAEEAIAQALIFERESIAFYEAMKKGIPEDIRGIIDRLIDQEYQHIDTLEQLRGVGFDGD